MFSPQTYTANILTVVNPYRDMAEMYTDKVMTGYKGTSLGKLDPHTFAIGGSSFRIFAVKFDNCLSKEFLGKVLKFYTKQK